MCMAARLEVEMEEAVDGSVRQGRRWDETRMCAVGGITVITNNKGISTREKA
jgi:hypothetical protein